MKKVLVALMALCAIAFTSCHKNEAEEYVGTYNVEATGIYTIHVASLTNVSDTVVESGTMTIELDGEDGNVIVSGDVFNTKGHVEGGVLYLEPEEHLVKVGAFTIMGQTFDGFDYTGTLTHANTTINGDLIDWTASGTATDTYTFMGQTVNITADITYACTAQRK